MGCEMLTYWIQMTLFFVNAIDFGNVVCVKVTTLAHFYCAPVS